MALARFFAAMQCSGNIAMNGSQAVLRLNLQRGQKRALPVDGVVLAPPTLKDWMCVVVCDMLCFDIALQRFGIYQS